MNFVILADDEFGKFNLNVESIPVVRKFKSFNLPHEVLPVSKALFLKLTFDFGWVLHPHLLITEPMLHFIPTINGTYNEFFQ